MEKKQLQVTTITSLGRIYLGPNKWDAGTKAIYERIMVGHGKEA